MMHEIILNKISPLVKAYWTEIGYKLPDGAKATMIWNLLRDRKMEIVLAELERLAQETGDVQLKKQIEERISYERACFEQFKKNDGTFVYMVLDEDGDHCGFFMKYDTAIGYMRTQGYLEIEKYKIVMGDLIPEARVPWRMNPNLSGVSGIDELEPYRGEPVACLKFTKESMLANIWSNEMDREDELRVSEFNPKRFECSFVEFPVPPALLTKGVIVREITSGKYGVVATNAVEWELFLQKARKGGYCVDYYDYSIVVYFLSDEGGWSHDHINPIHLEIDMPQGKENFSLVCALEELRDSWSPSSKSEVPLEKKEDVQ